MFIEYTLSDFLILKKYFANKKWALIFSSCLISQSELASSTKSIWQSIKISKCLKMSDYLGVLLK